MKRLALAAILSAAPLAAVADIAECRRRSAGSGAGNVVRGTEHGHG